MNKVVLLLSALFIVNTAVASDSRFLNISIKHSEIGESFDSSDPTSRLSYVGLNYTDSKNCRTVELKKNNSGVYVYESESDILGSSNYGKFNALYKVKIVSEHKEMFNVYSTILNNGVTSKSRITFLKRNRSFREVFRGFTYETKLIDRSMDHDMISLTPVTIVHNCK